MSLKFGPKIGFCAAAITLLLGGCGGFDGVQLNGKVFDAMGLNGSSEPQGDPKMAVRQPLTIPPTTEALPPPGSGKADRPTLADIQDPDKTKAVNQAELERQQAEYCQKNYTEPMQRGDASADSASGPLGSCHPSVLTGVANWMKKPAYKDDADGDSDGQ
ncbi:MAG: hypothetical protein QM780_11645 [Hyphomicrobium sp.]|uniref:hypothetical protein n=1 Tax=Hyphomicrobium sp. TaxID=82 RepID=UPI0039E3BB3C